MNEYFFWIGQIFFWWEVCKYFLFGGDCLVQCRVIIQTITRLQVRVTSSAVSCPTYDQPTTLAPAAGVRKLFNNRPGKIFHFLLELPANISQYAWVARPHFETNYSKFFALFTQVKLCNNSTANISDHGSIMLHNFRKKYLMAHTKIFDLISTLRTENYFTLFIVTYV